MSWSTNAPVHQSNTSHAWTFHGCNLKQLLVFKSVRVGWRVHQSTSQTSPTCGPSTGAFWNNSLILRLYESVDECTSPLVKNLPRVDDPCMQSRTIDWFTSQVCICVKNNFLNKILCIWELFSFAICLVSRRRSSKGCMGHVGVK